MTRKSQAILFLFIGLFFMSRCRDRNQGVPLVIVDREINVTLPSYSSLAVVGGHAYVSGGSQGLFVYRKTQDDFVVYDRHATYDINQNCAVVIDSSSTVELVDHCSGSRYSVFDGLVTNGPATLPLKQYNTSFNGTILHIYN